MGSVSKGSGKEAMYFCPGPRRICMTKNPQKSLFPPRASFVTNANVAVALRQNSQMKRTKKRQLVSLPPHKQCQTIGSGFPRTSEVRQESGSIATPWAQAV